MHRINAVLPTPMRAWIAAYARQRHVSKAAVMRWAVELLMKQVAAQQKASATSSNRETGND